jgi:hypothetical protein
MSLRASENEKDDVLRSYKESCIEITKLTERVDYKE